MSLINNLIDSADPEFCITYNDYDPDQEPCRESLTTICNGNFGVRGSIEVQSKNSSKGVYIAGLYDKPDRDQRKNAFGLNILNKSLTPALAICPDFLDLRILIDNREIDLINCSLQNFEQILDMERGLRFFKYTLKDFKAREIEIKTLFLASKNDMNHGLEVVEIESKNYDGPAVIEFINHQQTHPVSLPRIRDYICQTDVKEAYTDSNTVLLHSSVRETQKEILLITTTSGDGDKTCITSNDQTVERFAADLKAGENISFQKHILLLTSLEKDLNKKQSIKYLKEKTKQNAELNIQENIQLWKDKWKTARVDIQGDKEVNLGLRWCQFSLFQLGNEQNPNVSISATGLHGPGYFGHIFWDTEIYMLPFFILTCPDVARNLLLYRYNRLETARANAKEAGLDGAKFPWVSTDTGLDVTPPDWESSGREIHINGAISYAFYQYLMWTADQEFYKKYGIEIIAETALFWASRAKKGEDGKYHLLNVVGPDEYNVHANDNYYTNHLAVWNMKKALDDMNMLLEEDPGSYENLTNRVKWSDAAVTKIKEVINNMYFPPIEEGVCEQFRGFFKLPDIPDLKRDQYGRPISDRGHKYDGSSQMSKQPDVVMMHYLFPDDFSTEIKKKSFNYYDKRCVQGSSLSPSVSCIVGLQLGIGKRSYEYFRLSSLLNMKNLHTDKTLSQGIHVACAGGTCKAVLFGYGGISIKNDKLHINPTLTDKWQELSYNFLFRGRHLKVSADRSKIKITLEGKPLEVIVNSKKVLLKPSQQYCKNI